MTNYKNMSSISKYFTFGTQRTQLDVKFTWYDSFTRQKKVSSSPLIDQYSSLYNYAVCCSRIACFMDLGGDGIKVASKLFQQAAWIFEQLQTMVTALAAGESSTDFNKETLSQNSNLCLAQAQYLFFKKASDAGMKPAVLSNVAAQVAIYFDKAFEANQSNI